MDPLGMEQIIFQIKKFRWAVKYTLDALYTTSRAHFDKTHGSFPTQLRSDDGRLKVIVDSIEGFQLDKKRQIANFRILDVGAGKGRFASALRRMYPSENFELLTFQTKCYRSCNQEYKLFKLLLHPCLFLTTISMANLQLKFSSTYQYMSIAIVEIKRVLKPSGRIIIIDKNAADPRAELLGIRSMGTMVL